MIVLLVFVAASHGRYIQHKKIEDGNIILIRDPEIDGMSIVSILLLQSQTFQSLCPSHIRVLICRSENHPARQVQWPPCTVFFCMSIYPLLSLKNIIVEILLTGARGSTLR